MLRTMGLLVGTADFVVTALLPLAPVAFVGRAVEVGLKKQQFHQIVG